nr:MAG TPA: hypothetical protein [Caudoviricetes sp.]
MDFTNFTCLCANLYSQCKIYLSIPFCLRLVKRDFLDFPVNSTRIS